MLFPKMLLSNFKIIHHKLLSEIYPYYLFSQSFPKFTLSINSTVIKPFEIFEFAEEHVDEMMGLLNSISWINVEYTHPYFFHFWPISIIDPLYAHLSNFSFVFISNRIPNRINWRLSHFPLERWSTPASPTFV